MKFSAQFYDGQIAKAHDATVTLQPTHLAISVSNGPDTLWPLDAIKIFQAPMAAIPGSLSYKDQPDTRLVIEDNDVWKEVIAALPKQSKGGVHISDSWPVLGFLGGLAALCLVLIFTFGPAIMGSASVFFPQSWMDYLGRQTMENYQGVKQCDSFQGRHALYKLVTPILQAAGEDTDKIYVFESKRTVNAFAIPGGYIVIFSGLLDFVDSQEELAGILGHEVAHLTLRHSARQITRTIGMSSILHMILGGAGLVGDVAIATDIVQQMHYSRGDELEADKAGYGYLQKAGMNPEGVALFFEKFIEEEEKYADDPEYILYSMFSTHPTSRKRVESIKALSAGSETREYKALLDAAEWNDLKDICSKKIKFKLHD